MIRSESAIARLARLERELGAGYTRWVGTEAGQEALRAAAAEDRAARRLTRSGPRSAPTLGVVEQRAGRSGSVDVSR